MVIIQNCVFLKIVLFLSIVLSIIGHVVCRLTRYRTYNNLILYYEGGFGHTITGPDIVRRLFQDQRSAVFFIDKANIYNRYIASIWPESLCVEIFSGTLPIIGTAVMLDTSWRQKISYILRRVLPIFLPNVIIIDMFELFALLCKTPGSDELNVAYLDLWQKIATPPIGLPADLRSSVLKAIGAVDGEKICGIYLSHAIKGSEDSLNRSGSTIKEYLPVLRWLTLNGYRVLICGDLVLNEQEIKEFGSLVIDRNSCPIDHKIYAVFAATEVDIFIAESGGGFWLSSLAHIPTLLVNHFPLGTALPGSTILYKHLQATDGTMIAPLVALEHFNVANFVRGQGISPINNTSEELLSAVQDFVKRTEAGLPPPFLPPEVEEICRLTQKTSMLAHSPGAGLSPVWYKSTSPPYNQPSSETTIQAQRPS